MLTVSGEKMRSYHLAESLGTTTITTIASGKTAQQYVEEEDCKQKQCRMKRTLPKVKILYHKLCNVALQLELSGWLLRSKIHRKEFRRKRKGCIVTTYNFCEGGKGKLVSTSVRFS